MPVDGGRDKTRLSVVGSDEDRNRAGTHRLKLAIRE